MILDVIVILLTGLMSSVGGHYELDWLTIDSFSMEVGSECGFLFDSVIMVCLAIGGWLS